jgi:hypothetical protein
MIDRKVDMHSNRVDFLLVELESSQTILLDIVNHYFRRTLYPLRVLIAVI